MVSGSNPLAATYFVCLLYYPSRHSALKYEMKYTFTPMSEKYANDIVANWHYDDIYWFYDMAADEDDLRIFMDTKNWQNITKAVLNENDEFGGVF